MTDLDTHLIRIAAQARPLGYADRVTAHIEALRGLLGGLQVNGTSPLDEVLDVLQAVALADDPYDAAAAMRDRCRDVPADYLGGE